MGAGRIPRGILYIVVGRSFIPVTHDRYIYGSERFVRAITDHVFRRNNTITTHRGMK